MTIDLTEYRFEAKVEPLLDSWIPGVFPTQGDALLFDTNKNPKPAYYAVADALKAAKTIGHYKA